MKGYIFQILFLKTHFWLRVDIIAKFSETIKGHSKLKSMGWESDLHPEWHGMMLVCDSRRSYLALLTALRFMKTMIWIRNEKTTRLVGVRTRSTTENWTTSSFGVHHYRDAAWGGKKRKEKGNWQLQWKSKKPTMWTLAEAYRVT